MTGPRTAVAIRVLHWVIALVVLYEAWRTFHGAFAAVHSGVPPAHLTWVRLILSGAEIVAAVLFLIPWTAIAAAYFLEGIFAVAIAIHALHGDFAGLEFLFLYATAVYVVLCAHQEKSTPGLDPVNGRHC